jgi:hypothetical protein
MNNDERSISLEQLNGAVLVYETKDGEEVRVEFDE